MKKISLTSKKTAGILLVPALAAVFSLGSCQKKEGMGKPSCQHAESERSVKMHKSVAKVLRDFAVGTAGGSSVSTTSGGGSSVFSDPAANFTTYTTSGGTVYSWSDPSTGTTFTLSESSGGSGFGQLAYNGKSFNYNYVLSIKASENDPAWTGFFNGRDLRGVVAIDGELTDSDFTLKNIAFFFVATTGGSGTYKLIDFGSNSPSLSDGLGEIVDLSSAPDGTTLSGMGTSGTIYVTAGGHIDVSDSEFSLQSDAKIMDVTTSAEYSVDGSIMTE
ncbi:MAG: hypothetical protein JWO09_668 [Bacteroidetes bacterium]|nr:hypothetical protein [Bacteroidota bacterium]